MAGGWGWGRWGGGVCGVWCVGVLAGAGGRGCAVVELHEAIGERWLAGNGRHEVL